MSVRLDGIPFRQLSKEDNLLLTAPVSEDEIREAVWSCDGDKSPGPDGFNFSFFKNFWDTVKSEVCEAVEEFFVNGKLPKGVSLSFLVLTPKKDNPQSLSDYRSISLTGSIYKIVSKVLAARIKLVLGKVISESQTAFYNRKIPDGVLVINEIVDVAKRENKECLILKVDFEKAYDSVNWDFLDYMMERLGFCNKWRSWMKDFIFKGDVSIFVNGSPSEEIKIGKALQQGDPLAPFLFMILAEMMGGMMQKATALGKFKGFKVGEEVEFSILQYADDTVFVGEASSDNLWALKAVLRWFELASGIRVNFHKSDLVGINVEDEFLQTASNFLNCKIGSIPFKFMGVPIGADSRKLSTSNPVTKSAKKRLNEWKTRMAPMSNAELKEYLKKAAQKKGVQVPPRASTQANLSGVLTSKQKIDAMKGVAGKQNNSEAPEVKQGNPNTPLVEPLKTVYASPSRTSPREDTHVAGDVPSWCVVLKSVEFEFKKMDGINKEQLKELGELRDKIKESETKKTKVDSLEKEVDRLRKQLEEEKNKQIEREKELKAEKDKAMSDLELEKGIAKSLRGEVTNKAENITKLLGEIEGLKLEAAIQYQTGFDNAVEQVQYLHPEIDISEASMFKMVRNGELVAMGDSDNNEGDDEMVDNMATDGSLENNGEHREDTA